MPDVSQSFKDCDHWHDRIRFVSTYSLRIVGKGHLQPMRFFMRSSVLLLFVFTLGVSFAIPAEDEPNSSYDESEQLPSETPLATAKELCLKFASAVVVGFVTSYFSSCLAWLAVSLRCIGWSTRNLGDPFCIRETCLRC